MARRILVTGGTVFVSKYIARYFAGLGADVVVLNRNTKERLEGVTVIEADRHALGNVLDGQHFDAVIGMWYPGARGGRSSPQSKPSDSSSVRSSSSCWCR